MNQFFYESRSKEKVKDLLKEGQRSQAFHRSGSPTASLLNGLPKLILVFLAILGILQILVR